MRILIFGNNRVACECARWLRERGEEIVGLVLHPEERRRFGAELVEACGVEEEVIFPAERLREPEILSAIRALGADIGLSIFFGYILKPALIDAFPSGVVNLHPSYLPYNRGGYPNVWSIVDQTPAGVTLHYVDPGVDTGDLIAQREVPVRLEDTGETLYRRLEAASVNLFQQSWPALRSGSAPRMRQTTEAGTFHRTRDVDLIDEIDLDREYCARDLINILRARTFAPYPGAYFREGGRRVYLQLKLIPEDGLNDSDK